MMLNHYAAIAFCLGLSVGLIWWSALFWVLTKWGR